MADAFTTLKVTFKDGEVSTYSASATPDHYYFNDDRFYRCVKNFTRPQIYMPTTLSWCEYSLITNIAPTEYGSIVDPGGGAPTELTDLTSTVLQTVQVINTFYADYKAKLALTFDQILSLTDVVSDLDTRMATAEEEITDLDVRVTALEKKVETIELKISIL